MSVFVFLTTFLWSRLMCAFIIIMRSETATFNHLPPHDIFNYSSIKLVCANKISFICENFYERFFQVTLCGQSLKRPTKIGIQLHANTKHLVKGRQKRATVRTASLSLVPSLLKGPGCEARLPSTARCMEYSKLGLRGGGVYRYL